MTDYIPILISILALVGTFYQLKLQRIHNEKSLKPLIQIDLTDLARIIAIDVQNNGVGPITIEALKFIKNGEVFPRIQDCLSFNPRHYDHIDISADNKKVLSPGGKHEAFFKKFELEASDDELNDYRRQLSAVVIRVEGKDIYDNTIVAEKNLEWFARHLKQRT